MLRFAGKRHGGQSEFSARAPERDYKTMGKHVFLKTVEIGAVVVTLRSLDGATWSSDLKDLRRLEAERKEIRATTQKAFRTIGTSDRWGCGARKRRAG